MPYSRNALSTRRFTSVMALLPFVSLDTQIVVSSTRALSPKVRKYTGPESSRIPSVSMLRV